MTCNKSTLAKTYIFLANDIEKPEFQSIRMLMNYVVNILKTRVLFKECTIQI